MPAKDERPDEIAYSVSCCTCGARPGEPCVVLNPNPRSIDRLSTEPLPPHCPPTAEYFEKRLHREALPTRRTCDHAHKPRLDAARRLAAWHRGIDRSTPTTEIVRHDEAQEQGAGAHG
jgi:hypothetical protein